MLSEDLKQLIEASLVDGVLTPEERKVLVKRAISEGNDPDEVNLLLDAEVQKIRLKKQASAPKVNKCPACGEILPPLTGICPTCGSVVSAGGETGQSLESLMEKMHHGLAQLHGGTANGAAVVATVEENWRRAKTLYGENKKVQDLLDEIQKELDECKVKVAAREKEEAELKKLEAKAKIKAMSKGGSGGGLGYESNKGCYKGCLIGVIIFFCLGFIGMCMDADTESKVDKQYTQLVSQLDSLKTDSITIENYVQQETRLKDIIWTDIDEYSDYEKKKKETFEKLIENYIDQLSTFYALHHDEIDDYNGYVVHDLKD